MDGRRDGVNGLQIGRKAVAGARERESCELVMKMDEEARKYGDLEAFRWVKMNALDVIALCTSPFRRGMLWVTLTIGPTAVQRIWKGKKRQCALHW